MRGLEGKNVLVTGGTSGIGQAIAMRFAEEGANVAINYLRTPDEADDTEEHSRLHRPVRAARRQGHPRRRDVSKEDDVVRMFEETSTSSGAGHAGQQRRLPDLAPLHEIPAADFDKVIATNLRGAYMCAREAISRSWRTARAARSSMSPASTS